MERVGGKPGGVGGWGPMGSKTTEWRTVHGAGQAVWTFLNQSLAHPHATRYGEGALRQLLELLPNGELDLSQQPPLSQEALSMLLTALNVEFGKAASLKTLRLGHVDDLDVLCEHMEHLRVNTLDVSRLRVRCQSVYAVPSIKQMKQLQHAAHRCGGGSLVKVVVVDGQSCLEAQKQWWQSTFLPHVGAGARIEFVAADFTALELEAMARNAFQELLLGGFEAHEVEALLNDPRFHAFRELNLEDMVVDQVPWLGLPLVLSSTACPIRTLVLPPPSGTILRMFGQAKESEYLNLIFGPAGEKPRRYAALDLVELRHWSPAQVQVHASALLLRPVGQYVVEPMMKEFSPASTLLECVSAVPNLRVKELTIFDDKDLVKYRNVWWDRLLHRSVAGNLDELFDWPEFHTTHLDLGFGPGDCRRAVWRELANLLKHLKCPLESVRFHQVEVSVPSGGRKEFLRTFVNSGLGRLDLSVWCVKDGRLPHSVKYYWVEFGEDDLQTIDAFDVPAHVPVIVLSRDQITALRSRLEALSTKGWLFEDKEGNRVPKAPEPIDKGRLWLHLDLGHDDEVRRLLVDANASKTRFAEIKAFAKKLSDLRLQGQGEAMPEGHFTVVSNFVAQAVRTSNERGLRGVLMLGEQYKSLSLDQCDELLKPRSVERQNLFKAISHPEAYEKRVQAIREALSGSWDTDAIQQGFNDDPTLSPLYRVWINGWARRTAQRGQHLLNLLEEVELAKVQK